MPSKKHKIKPNPNPNRVIQNKQTGSPRKPSAARHKTGPSVVADGGKKYLIPALIFILCFILYGNTIRNNYALDDDIYTRHNLFVQQGFSHLWDIFDKGSLYGFNKVGEQQYRPIALLDFMTEVQIFGLNPHVNHFFNVLFFALACMALYLLLKRLFYNSNPAIPVAILLLYLFHPIHTEVVANIKSRDEILGFLFGTVSLLLLMKQEQTGREKGKPYLWSLIAFACAGFSKENYLTFAIVMPLMLYYFTQKDIKSSIRTSLPFFGIVLFYLLVRTAVLTNNTISGKMDIINNSLMAAKSSMEQLATEFMMLGKYIGLLIIPYPLSYDYSYNQIPIVSFANIKAVGSLLLYLALGSYALWTFRKKTVYGFAILYYFITIFLTSNLLIKIGSSFGERFLFAPSLGYCMALPFIIASLFRLNPAEMKWRQKNYFYAAIGVILLIYASITIPRNRDWQDNYTLFTADIAHASNSARAHEALASEYRVQAENNANTGQRLRFYQLSLDEFRKALAIYPDADTYYNMGVSYYEAGMHDSALSVYLKAIEVNPAYTLADNNIGVIYFERKQYGDAINYFEKYYQSDTSNLQALMNIGAAYQNEGNYSMAMEYYNMVLKKDPNNAGVLSNIARMKK